MKISIVTPSFNQGEFLERTMLSVLNQGYPDLEYIVIDGGSTDDSCTIIETYSDRLAYWCSENDNGQSHAINKGLQKATGELIGWLNSDDLYYPGSLFELASEFRDHPETDVVFGNYDYIDAGGKIVHRRREIPFDFATSYWTKECFHANVAGLFRKSCFDRFGGIREDLHLAMDYELYLRFGANGCRFRHVDKPMGAYRLHSTSKTVTSQSRSRSEVRRIQGEYRSKFHVSDRFRHVLRIYYQVLRYIRKLLHGCYSFENVASIRVFAGIRRGV